MRVVHFFLALTLFFSDSASAEIVRTEKETIEVTTFAAGLERPWGAAFMPDGRMLVTEKSGRLRVIDANGNVSAPLAGIPEVDDSGQGGLLDVEVDPAFSSNQLVYLSYSEPGANGVAGTAVGRGKLGDAKLEQFEVIWRQSPKTRSGAHYGSRFVFNRDGTLFVTLGDRYSLRAMAQV
jgi:aldose sugar dehydrogenase